MEPDETIVADTSAREDGDLESGASETSVETAVEALSDTVAAGDAVMEQLAEATGAPEQTNDDAPEAVAPESGTLTIRRELILGRTWGIVPEVLVEIASTPILADADVEATQAAATQAASPARSSSSGDGSVAVIPLCGVVTPHGSLLARLFGYASGLEGFRENFRQALADDNVSAIVIDVDSPGGLIDQVPETAAEIFAARGTKPVVAVANTMCASAAYWIACQADEIVATPSAQVGSIGVFTVQRDLSRLQQAMGIKTTIISAGRFKTEGNPYEPLSKQAQAALQSNVDEIYGMFTADIARARSMPVEAIQAGYGEGRVVLASQALALKMVDGIETLEQTITRLGGNADVDELESEDLAPDLDDDDVDEDGTEAAGGSRYAAAADYLSSGRTRPPWQIGASRPFVGGRL